MQVIMIVIYTWFFSWKIALISLNTKWIKRKQLIIRAFRFPQIVCIHWECIYNYFRFSDKDIGSMNFHFRHNKINKNQSQTQKIKSVNILFTMDEWCSDEKYRVSCSQNMSISWK